MQKQVVVVGAHGVMAENGPCVHISCDQGPFKTAVLTICELIQHALAVRPHKGTIVFLDVCYAGALTPDNVEGNRISGVAGLAQWVVDGHIVLGHVDAPFDFMNGEYSTDRLVQWMHKSWYC